MPTGHHSNASPYGNLFADVESDLEDATRPARRSLSAGAHPTAQARRSLVVLLEPIGTPASADRFTRGARLLSLPRNAKHPAVWVDVSARRLLDRVIDRPYGALVIVLLIGVLALATGWALAPP